MTMRLKSLTTAAALALVIGAPVAFAQSNNTGSKMDQPRQSPTQTQQGNMGTRAVEKVTGATGTTRSGRSAARMSADETFVMKAANSGMFEIESSRIALERSKNEQVRSFAQMMVDDHTKNADKLKAAAGDMMVPAELDRQHARMVRQLRNTSDASFDRLYVNMQRKGHQEAIASFTAYSKNGKNDRLTAYAKESLPTLQQHADHAKQISAPAAGGGKTQKKGS